MFCFLDCSRNHQGDQLGQQGIAKSSIEKLRFQTKRSENRIEIPKKGHETVWPPISPDTRANGKKADSEH
jgi:hypothetical protein